MTEQLSENYIKKLFGRRTDIEDALKRLDDLSREEAQMAAAQILRLSVDNRVVGIDERVADVVGRVAGVDHLVAGVHDRVVDVGDRVVGVDDRWVDVGKRSWFPNRIHNGITGSIIFTGNQLRQDFNRWLSPPDPSTNHNITSNAHHNGTATWFFEGRMYNEWKSTDSDSLGSLLWLHGKRESLSHSVP